MTTRDFVYWLQGFFELAEPETLGISEVKHIRQHLDMVFTLGVSNDAPHVEGRVPMAYFVYWLRGFLEGKEALDAVQVTAFRKLLDDIFVHDIDPTHSTDPEVQATLNAIHAGEIVEPPAKPKLTINGPGPLKPLPPRPGRHEFPNGAIARC